MYKKYKNAYIGAGIGPQAFKQTCLLFRSADNFFCEFIFHLYFL